MRQINVETINGIQSETVYDMKELSYLRKLLDCKESKKRNVHYLDIPISFDIETTNIYQKDDKGKIMEEPRPYAFMYHWQFCLDDQVCFGRTWNEMIELFNLLTVRMNLDDKHRIVIWVHNLAFEWQFMQHFVDYKEGFFKESRAPLRILLEGGIELRDSLALSNMSLQKFCENEKGVIHYKLSGDSYNYDKIRTPITIMEEYEEAYCYNDVRGLCECIKSRMQEHTLANMPMTSTGYVRSEFRSAMQKNKKNRYNFVSSQLDEETYSLCRVAFRGGDTHANIRYVDQTITGVHSKDLQSSYPAAMMLDKYPMTAFFPVRVETYLNRDMSEYALLMRVRLVNCRYVGTCGIPYIAHAKCDAITSDRVIDNGRILYAGIIELTLTDIDLEIIENEYDFDDIFFSTIYASRYGSLSNEFKETLISYFRAKTALKGVSGQEYEYMKSKNRINSAYGMMVQRIDQVETVYEDYKYTEVLPDLTESLQKYYKSRNSFLSYQHGVWVTCNARKRLRKMLVNVGKDVIYCDTDSIKYIGDHEKEFEEENHKIIEACEKVGAYAVDRNGKKQYLGIWDDEGSYEEFKTLGAKKYVVKKDGVYYSTIAGVSKKVGKEYFNKHGIDAFEIGTKITDSGHLTAYYNDDAIHYITVDRCRILTASNVALVNNSYTIGVTDEYLDLLEKTLANIQDINYI